MSDQVSEAENPGQAIYDALSDEAKAAVDALPETVLQPKHAAFGARLLTDPVVALHEIKPNAWSIGCDGLSDGAAFVFANDGSINVVSLLPSECRVLIEIQDSWPENCLQLIESEVVPADCQNPRLRQVRLTDVIIDVWETLEEGFQSALPQVL